MCEKMDSALLQDYIEGIIDPLEKIFVENHLTSCRECRREISELKLVFWDLGNKNNYEIEYPKELDDMGEELIDIVLGRKSKARKVMEMQTKTIKLTGNFLEHVPGAKQTPKLLKQASKGITKGLAKGVRKFLIAK